jgi:hypothetical protein
MVRSWTRLLVAIVIAWTLSMSFTMHLAQASAALISGASAASIDGRAGITQHSGTCHDHPEPSVPAAAKFPACCVVCCSNVPATPFAQAHTVAFADQPFAADTLSQPAGHDIHPDPHPPRA